MNSRSFRWLVVVLPMVAVVWLLWPRHQTSTMAPASTPVSQVVAKKAVAQPAAGASFSASTAPRALALLSLHAATNTAAALRSTNKFAWRLTNTPKSLRELSHDAHAILLANALIDTRNQLNLDLPKNLQAKGDPGAYIVQANGVITPGFRATLALAGAQIVSYIPNNAYLVQASASQVATIAGSGLTVLPYEPYYKVSSGLIAQAATEQPLPPTTLLNVGAFASDGSAVQAEIQNLGGIIVAQDASPFGPIFRVSPPADWTALAQLPGVQVVEPTYRRMPANDLSRVDLGVSEDTLTNANYLDLYGSNVVVEVNDTGIDSKHPDFTLGGNPNTGPGGPTRILGDSTGSLVDANGHGTFVAGIIAGNGAESWGFGETPMTNVGVYASGSISNADFRGKAPLASLFSVGALGGIDTPYNIANGTYNPDIFDTSDYYLQTAAALTNALISNNSWTYGGDTAYDLAAASYDAAVRDALPTVTGSQPVLFIFAAGDNGGGNDDGSGATADTIESPATAKNVITVGALQQARNITNIVTAADGSSNEFWLPETESSTLVADYSARGNVGIGVEGESGRFKPDLVAPGNFIVSTRSSEWDQFAYYDPTNFASDFYLSQEVSLGQYNYESVGVPGNAVAMTIQVSPNAQSPQPFPTNMPIYVSSTVNFPGPGPSPASNDFSGFNSVSSPPDGGPDYIDNLQQSFLRIAVGGSTNFSSTYELNYDLTVTFTETNDMGNYFQVLSNLNNTLGPYYQYASGTSMSAPAVSGMAALIQDFFTNTLHINPSPALLKGMLINGARGVGSYEFEVTNAPNDQGWGLPSLPNSLPSAWAGPLRITPPPTTGYVPPPTNAFFFQDQSSTNALATGDSQTFQLSISPDAQAQPLRVTLTWTDPPGDPAAGIKLVNNLDIVVTNLDTAGTTNATVFYGNDFSSVGNPNYSVPETTNSLVVDMVNNVRNIFLQPTLGTNYTVTVVARSVNVNAVTAQTNSVVQDFALVISSGDGFSGVTNAFTLTANPPVRNPTADEDITIVTSTNTPLLNQIAGENSPLLGTNTVGVGTNSLIGTNGQVTIGMTNQWHFYVVTNYTGFTNAAFITFFPLEMAVSRMGTLSDTVADATRPQGDIDLYVAKEPGLLTLDPIVISNCVNGVGGDAVSAGPNGTEFVAYSNSVENQVYYIGVKSEDHLGTTYGFLPVFTAFPFSSLNSDGSESINGLTLPVSIVPGTPKNPSQALVFALALYPLTVNEIIVTNQIWHQNFGDLVGQLSHDNINDILNNHDGYGNTIGSNAFIYFDSPINPISTPIGPVTVPAPIHTSDGPGSLVSYQGQPVVGPWILTEADNAFVQTGSIVAFGLRAYPHEPANKGLDVYIAGGGEFSDFIDVPAGVTNMTLNVTNETLPTTQPPLVVYLKYGSAPTPVPIPTVFDQTVTVSNGVAPYIGGSISVGPTSIPPLNPGRYYYEIYNPSVNPATNVFIIATFSYTAVPSSETFQATTQTPLPDDAVATNTIVITNTETIFSTAVGVVIDHPRVSDLTLTLISPLNQRYTLVENRGGDTANMGHLDITTNFFGTASAGGALGNTNVIGPVPNEGTLLVDYDMYTAPDNMDVYYDGVDIFHSGYVSGTGQFVIPYGPGTDTNITIVMDQGGDPDTTSLWTYTPQVVSENFNYLTLTDDTNLAPELIKFAIPPFNLDDLGTNYTLSDFEGSTNEDYLGPTNILDASGGWTVPAAATNVTVNFTNSALLVTNITVYTNNLVSVVTDPATAYSGSNYLALGLGTITRNIVTIPTRQYTVSYSYRGPGIAGWWRGEGNALDSANPETNGNNGELIGRFTFPEGEVGQAFGMVDQGSLYQFAGTNNYVQIPQAPGLDVGAGSGLTVEGWINPTNLYTQEPLVEWLSRMPTNAAVTNIAIVAGPFLYRGTDHYYYLLNHTNWTTSEMWATNMGGHLVTINDANEQNWVYDTFGDYGGTNRNLWIGLNDVATAGNYVWTSGETPDYYNWVTGQPDNSCNGNELYTVMLGATNTTPGLWVLADQNGGYCTNNGYTLPATNGTYGVVELDTIPTNGVQFWVSVTNSPATGNSILSSNGCLYANLVDTTNGFHEIWSAPGLVQSNVYQHVALTYNTNSGMATLYYNGTNVCSTNLGVFTPKTTGDVLLGKDMSLLTNNYYSGAMDEMSIYGRCLSDAEIAAIYEISERATNNPGTNGQVVANGKFDPAYPPAIGLAVANVTLAGRTSVIVGDNTNWQRVNYTFVATSNLAPFQITGIAPGILLDDFTVSEAALGNLYYQPEQPLDGLVGESAAGTWTLEILDNRAGDTNALAKLVSWQLQFVLATNSSIPVTLYPEMPGTNTVPPGDIAYFYVPIPGWSHWATNILVSSSANVEFLFNPTNPPTGTGPGDQILLASGTNYVSPALETTNPPVLPLTETNFYYLGVKNISAVPATVVVRVDFDITSLTNDVPVPGILTTNEAVQYYSFDVSTNNPQEATFQLLKLSGNAYLVASYGTPLPTITNFAYGSFNVSNADQNIYIQTNSQPVPLAPGRWYLGVYRNDPGPVTYSVLAKELDAGQTNVITLTNNVPFRFTTGPGAALTNFFLFNVTNAAQNIHFELYDMTGDGDLTVQTNGLPLMPPFYDSSQEPGLIPEYVYLRTNNVLTNLAGLWYLGVPNHETNQISFTILAVNDSLLITNTTPAFPGAVGAATYVSGGRGSTNVYHVTNLSDDNSPGSLRYGINAFTNNANIVFDVSGNIALASPLVITNSNLTIAGQTAPGDGITLQNYPTLLDGATNVIIRYLRFRPGDTGTNTAVANFNLSAGDSLAFTNALNVMIDHVSASWSTNAVLSVLSSSNVTVQWSVIADSFSGTNTSSTTTNVLEGQGSILRYGAGSLSFNHNLYADNNSSSPLLGDNLVLDFVNNVVYNWGILPGWSVTNDPIADPSGSTNEMNYAGNYVLAGLHSQTNYIAFWSGSTNTWVFQTNNFIDAYTNETMVTNSTETNTVYILNGSDTGWSMFTTNTTEFGDPFPLRYPGITNATIPTATAEEAYQAYEKVLDFAGDQESRDSVDLSLMRHVRTQSGAFILSQSQVGGWPALSSQPTLLDTDQDGIPDYWEITFGMNPTNAADGAIVNTNTGYSALETYLNWLAAPHALTVGTNPVSVSLYQLAGGTGRLTFYVTNALNGSVVLTNEMVTNYFYTTNGIYTNSVVTFTNSLAIFTPTNNYTSSFTNPASFDFYVTNNDTTAWFGPVTVSVVVSATNILLATPVITLTNGVPFSVTNDPVYNFSTTNSPGAVVFQIYNLSGPATLVLQTNGVPVAPDYLATSGTARTNGVEILMVTNSALTGVGGANVLSRLNQNWYLGVNNGGTNTLSYTIVATEIPVSPNIITLTNNVPFTWTAGPGPDLTNFFRYDVTNSADVVQFQLSNLSGNGDLTAQTNALPFAPEYYAISQQPGTAPETIQVPAGSGSPWFLGVPNNDPIPITYTIEAQESASLTPVLTNSAPVTNMVGSGGIDYYLVEVPEFATVVSNILASASGPLNLWYSTNTPPTFGQPDDVLLLQNVTSGTNVFGTNGIPQLVPGGYYYLGVENNGSSTVTYTLETEFGFSIPVPMAPTVVTVAATNTTAFSSTLQATVTPNGATSTVYFAYGFTTNFGNFSTAVVVSNGLYSLDPIAIGVGNLSAATTYYFEAITTNEFGTNYGGVLTFTTPVAGPTVVTDPATSITSSGAELQAGVSPNGLPTTVYFEYGSSTSYGQFTSTQAITSSLNITNQNIGSSVAGLLPGMVYHYQAIAYNSAGTNYGGDLTFTNLALIPTVVTVSAVNITSTSATLQASVNPNGSPTAVYFEYGTTTGYGTLSTTNVLGGNLNTAQSVALNVTGLLPGVVYHFQAVGVNGAGTAYGGDLTFTVPITGPTVVTLPATNLTVANVTLPALVTPNGTAAQVYFVYGTTKSYGSQTAVTVLNNNLNTAQRVTSSVSGLLPGVVYHYQAIAFNSAGTNHGADLTFTNPAQPVSIFSIVSTNNGFLLSWYAPTNYQFKVQWSPTLGTNQWSTFTNTVVYTGPATPTNGLFTFFDNGSQSGGLGAIRFYRLELANLSGTLAVPSVTTLPATNVTAGSVTLPALVTPNGATATVYFNWGITTNYGNQTAATSLANNLYSSQSVTSILTGLSPGVVYHYQAVATNVVGTNYGADLTFTIPLLPSFPTMIVFTNHGFLVEWYAPTNYQFEVQWTTNLLSTTWFTFTNIVVYTGPITPTNGLFTFFDNGSQTGGFGPAGFYRLIPLAGASSPPPVLPTSGSIYQINPLATLVVTNTATNFNPNAILSYVVSGSLTGTNLPVVATNNGVVTVAWTPSLAQAGMTNIITTVVTDNSGAPVSASNYFEVIVYPLPVFTSVLVSPAEGVVILRWASVPQNQFQIGWTTNLLSPWTYVPTNAPYLTSVSTNFVYQDTNAVTGMRFYRLREVP